MQIRCPACAKTLQIGDHLAGKRVKCPCGSMLQVPGAPASAPATAPAPSSASAPQRAAAPARQAAPARPANPGALGIEHGEMNSLFDELTNSDMVVQGPTTVAKREKKPKDPLAAYGPVPPAATNRSASASSAKGPISTVRLSTAIVFFGLSALCALVAAKVLLVDKAYEKGSGTTAYIAGFVVGVCLPTVITLAIGLVVLRTGRR